MYWYFCISDGNLLRGSAITAKVLLGTTPNPHEHHQAAEQLVTNIISH
jgi:hypothetical protein